MKSGLLLLVSLLFLAMPVAAQEFGSISGVVTIGDRPIEGATVTAWVMNDPRGGNNGQPRVTRTNNHGAFSFVQVQAGRVVIQAELPQGGEPQSHNIEVNANHNTVVNFNFHDEEDDEFGVVYGSVTSADGPVAGAFVMLFAGDPNNGHRMYSTQTDRNGHYRIDHVLTGHYTARAQGEFGQVQDHEIDVAADEELEVNFELQGGNGGDQRIGRVAGTVSDPDGNGIARADVLIFAVVDDGGHNGGNHHEIRLMTHTDGEGHYSFEEVPVGIDRISAGKAGYEPFHGEVEVVENELTVCDIVLEPVHHEDIRFGSVSGTVMSEAGEALAEAHVLLIPLGDRGEHNDWPVDPNQEQLVTFTDDHGAYHFAEVPVGAYTARAAKRGYVSEDQHIEVAEGERTEANFILAADDDHGGGNGGGEGHHEGEPIELHGIAIVIEGDVADVYLLDTDADGGADCLLNFGPPDYDPENGAARPESGDEIDITGVIVGHMEPPLVLVYTINGNLWRDPNGDDHGGRPGGGDGWNGEGDLELFEAEGHVAVHLNSPWYHRYFLNVDDNERAEYVLFFGDDDYEPGNGLVRPENEDFVSIVGGRYQPRDGLPIIVVYQLNGQLWREPGDTLELYWQDPNAVKEADIIAPNSLVLVETYPNPFNPNATVSVTVPSATQMRVSLVDLTGREIALISSGHVEAGIQNLTLDGTSIKAGIYFLRVETPAGGVVQKVTLLK